jgi:glutaredoxin
MRPVTIYALSTCPWCRKTKQFFSERGVPYECIDYDLADRETQEAVLRDMDQLGATNFPCVRIGDVAIEGYDPERFEEALED